MHCSENVARFRPRKQPAASSQVEIPPETIDLVQSPMQNRRDPDVVI